MVYDPASMEQYIRQAAARRGIDPNIAVRVAKSEGLARDTWQSNYRKNGIREPSYGPFQLLVGGGGTGYPTGMGNDFKAQTGLDPSDPANAYAGVDFALDGAKRNGWGAWYGAAKAGIGNREGIGSFLSGSAPEESPPQNQYSGPAHAPTVARAAAMNSAPTPATPPADPNAGAGLIALLGQEGPKSWDMAKTFLAGTPADGGASPISGAAAGLQMIAQAQGQKAEAAPQIQAAPIDANAPDMSFMQMLMPKRKRGLLNVAG